MKQKLTKEQIENINSYSKEIVTIEDFMEAVRMTIGQYLGYTGNPGWLNAFRELFQNGLDEQSDPKSMCNWVFVRFTEANQQIDVEDNGRGIPFDDMERVFSDPHTSKNYHKEPYQYSAGRHGIGAKVTNAASSRFVVTSYILGEEKTVEFENGLPVLQTKVKKSSSGKQGTHVTAWPHPIMDDPKLSLTVADVLGLVSILVPLAKKGTLVEFEGVAADGKMVKQTVVNQDGLLTYLVNKTTNPLIAPVVMIGDTGQIRAEIAFTYDAQELSGDADIISFGNYCPTTDGTHVKGFLNAITVYFRDYMNKIYLNTTQTQTKTKKKKKGSELRVTVNDIKSGLKAVVHGLHLYPTFTGQAKESLSNEDIQLYFEKMIPVWLDEWAKNTPKDFAKLCRFFKDVAELRLKADESRQKIAAKYETSAITGLPAKFLKPNGTEHLELIIVEGDSALGSYKNTRHSGRQGIFPIRGKIVNVLDNTEAKIFANEEFQAIVTLVGGGMGRNFDITKVRWEKIIIATDADMDGYHIRTLIMKLFMKYMPGIIESGRLYLAVPPLFGLKVGKNKMRYFTDRLEYVEYVERSFAGQYKLEYSNGKPVSERDAIRILYENSDFVQEFEKLTFATDPYLLETVLVNRTLPLKELKKVILSKHRFVKQVDQVGDTVVVQGLSSQRYQTIFLNNNYLTTCRKVIPMLDKAITEFKLNGEPTSLYGLMKTFEDFQPNNITRYKGLGEMNEDQLAESTLYPSPTRQLMQYTVTDVKKDLDRLQRLECNKQELLKGVMS